MVEEEGLIDSLLVDRTEIIKGIAKDFQGFLRIDNSDFSPILPIRLSHLSTRNRVLIELGVSYMCYVGKLLETPHLERQELLRRCNVADSGLRGRLSEMRNERLITSSEGGDELTVEGMLEFRKLLTTLKEEYSQLK